MHLGIVVGRNYRCIFFFFLSFSFTRITASSAEVRVEEAPTTYGIPARNGTAVARTKATGMGRQMILLIRQE